MVDGTFSVAQLLGWRVWEPNLASFVPCDFAQWPGSRTTRRAVTGRDATVLYPYTPKVVTCIVAGLTKALPTKALLAIKTPIVLAAKVTVRRPNTLKATVASGTTRSYGTYSSKQQPKRATHYRCYLLGGSGQYLHGYSPSVYVTY